MRSTTLRFTPEGLAKRLHLLEQTVENLHRRSATPPNIPEPVVPLPFSWSGPVTDLLDMRAGPGWFPSSGTIYRIEYRFDDPAAVTVEWELDGVTFATHSPSTDTSQSLSQPYAGEDIIATVTADAGAEGLTALVFLR